MPAPASSRNTEQHSSASRLGYCPMVTPQLISDPTLSAADKVLLLALLVFARPIQSLRGAPMGTWASTGRIARQAGLSDRRSVKRRLASLVERGVLLRRTVRVGGQGEGLDRKLLVLQRPYPVVRPPRGTSGHADQYDARGALEVRSDQLARAQERLARAERELERLRAGQAVQAELPEAVQAELPEAVQAELPEAVQAELPKAVQAELPELPEARNAAHLARMRHWPRRVVIRPRRVAECPPPTGGRMPPPYHREHSKLSLAPDDIGRASGYDSGEGGR